MYELNFQQALDENLELTIQDTMRRLSSLTELEAKRFASARILLTALAEGHEKMPDDHTVEFDKSMVWLQVSLMVFLMDIIERLNEEVEG